MASDLSEETVEEIEDHDAVRTVLDWDGEVTAVLGWTFNTSDVRDLVEIAGEDAVVYSGDTRTSLKWGIDDGG